MEIPGSEDPIHYEYFRTTLQLLHLISSKIFSGSGLALPFLALHF